MTGMVLPLATGADAPREAFAGEPVENGAGGDRKLTLALPAGVVRELKARMAVEETTLRALVLEALRGAGYAVPAAEIRDRRRPGRP